jgi:hydrogenase expression/formation protein HypC
MCLGIPGRIVERFAQDESNLAAGLVEFEGLRRRVCLELVPDVAVDDYVIVHAGIAISQVNAEEAERLLQHLRAMDEGDLLEHAAQASGVVAANLLALRAPEETAQ